MVEIVTIDDLIDLLAETLMDVAGLIDVYQETSDSWAASGPVVKSTALLGALIDNDQGSDRVSVV